MRAGIGTGDGFDRVVGIQGAGGLDYGWGWVVRGTGPFEVIECSVWDGLDGEIEQATKGSRVRGDWAMNPVVVAMQGGFRCAGCGGGDEDRDDWKRVTGLVEVFQIERVIPDLVECGAVEGFFADFEFDDEHDAADEEHSIDAAAHAWDVEFEENGARKVL